MSGQGGKSQSKTNAFGKLVVQRHGHGSKRSYNAVEKAVETAVRVAGKDEIRALSPPRYPPPCGAAVHGECDCPRCQGLADREAVVEAEDREQRRRADRLPR